MRWLASNWIFILVVVGMLWMHLGHGGHGGHGAKDKSSPHAGHGDTVGDAHGGHAGEGTPATAGTTSDDRAAPRGS